MSYQSLDPSPHHRDGRAIGASHRRTFPSAGLARVSNELVQLSKRTASEAARLEAPILWLRALVAPAVLAGAPPS